MHRFTAEGKLIQSWGKPGGGPGEFNLPHGVAIESNGNVWVADRENDRLQIFTSDGQYLSEWTQVQRPTQVRIQGGRVYVSELWWRIGQKSMRKGAITANQFGRISIFDMQGKLLGRIEGGPNPARKDGLVAPHDVAVDSRGAVYVGEVTQTFGVTTGAVPEGTHSFQKFEPAGSTAATARRWRIDAMGSTERPLLDELKENAYLVLGFVALIWVVQILDFILPGRFVTWGILPRTIEGLRGIIFAPILHNGLFHVFANTIPFIVLGFLVTMYGQGTYIRVSVFVIVVGGLLTWLLARQAIHVGASGLIMGFLGFLLARGWH